MASESTQNGLYHPTKHLSDEEFKCQIQLYAKEKARSRETFENIHLPELSRSIDVVLIGDSMIERLKTTGKSTRMANLPSSFNAGVGGDKIENVLYRMDLGTMDLLKGREVKLWVVMVGTNNLRTYLSRDHLLAYQQLLFALSRTSPGSKIVVCGLFPRKDIKPSSIKKSNDSLRDLIEEMNNIPPPMLHFLEPPEITKEVHLDDHVHLNEEGYRIWDEVLYPVIEEFLRTGVVK